MRILKLNKNKVLMSLFISSAVSVSFAEDRVSDNTFSVGEDYEQTILEEAKRKAEEQAIAAQKKLESNVIKETARIDLSTPNLDVEQYLKENKHVEFVLSLPLLDGSVVKIKPYYSSLHGHSLHGKVKDYIDFYQYVVNQCKNGALPDIVMQSFQTRMVDQTKEFNSYLKQVSNGYYDQQGLAWLLNGFKAQTAAYECAYEQLANMSNDYDYAQKVKESVFQYKRRDVIYENIFKIINYLLIEKKGLVSSQK